MEHATPRVNYELMGKFRGRTVRLVCKVKRASDDQQTVYVETSDGQEVQVRWNKNVQVSDTFVEIIGSVEEGLTVKMLGGVGLGEDLDMKVVDDGIKLMHQPRYRDMFYPESA